MAEQAREQIRIDAPVERCFATLVDFEAYPEWAGDLKEVDVVDDRRRGPGRGRASSGPRPWAAAPPTSSSTTTRAPRTGSVGAR